MIMEIILRVHKVEPKLMHIRLWQRVGELLRAPWCQYMVRNSNGPGFGSNLTKPLSHGLKAYKFQNI